VRKSEIGIGRYSNFPTIIKTSTGKEFNSNDIKFDLISDRKELGAYRIIFQDDTVMYFTVEEWKEVLDQVNGR
jgi:hypothetical protein